MEAFMRGRVFVCATVAALVCAGVVHGGVTDEVDVPEFVKRGHALQRWLAATVPLEQTQFMGTHNAYNYNDDTGSTFEDPHNQEFPVLTQLELGARLVELDIHYIPERRGTAESKARLCHTNPETAELILEACPSTFLCGQLGVPDYGSNTGCSETAPPAWEVLAAIGDWLFEEGRESEVLILFIEDYMGDRPDILDAFLVDYFGDRIFTPAHLAEWSAKRRSSDGIFPSREELTADGQPRVLVFQFEATELAFSKSEYFQSVNPMEYTAANPGRRGDTDSCGIATDRPFTFVQGDRTRLDVFGIEIYNGPEERGVIEPYQTREILQCGFQAMLDGLNPDLSTSAVWTWGDEASVANVNQPIVALDVMTQYLTSVQYPYELTLACRSESNWRMWTLSEDEVLVDPTTDEDLSAYCPEGYFHDTPRTAREKQDLLSAVEADPRRGADLDLVGLALYIFDDPIVDDEQLPGIWALGDCPDGPISIKASFLTPGGRVALVYDSNSAPPQAQVPTSVCPSLFLDVQNIQYKLGQADANGDFIYNIPRSLTDAACALYFQVVDVDACEKTPLISFS